MANFLLEPFPYHSILSKGSGKDDKDEISLAHCDWDELGSLCFLRVFLSPILLSKFLFAMEQSRLWSAKVCLRIFFSVKIATKAS